MATDATDKLLVASVLERGKRDMDGDTVQPEQEDVIGAPRNFGVAGELGVQVTVEAREALARVLREHRPDVVFAHHFDDLHPDHAACGRLAREAWYLAGLQRLAELDGGPPARRPRRLFHFMGHQPFTPTLVVDIDAVWERKVEVIRCYASQLEPAHEGDEGAHFLFGADVLARAETKARTYGEAIGCRYGEPLFHVGPLPATDPLLY